MHCTILLYHPTVPSYCLRIARRHSTTSISLTQRHRETQRDTERDTNTNTNTQDTNTETHRQRPPPTQTHRQTDTETDLSCSAARSVRSRTYSLHSRTALPFTLASHPHTPSQYHASSTIPDLGTARTTIAK
eukprot:2550928-Rhodomonas_salina.1